MKDLDGPTSSGGLLTFGESMGLIASEDFGRFIHAPRAKIGFGGAESNVAIGDRRLGMPATWVSRVGDDPFGDLIRRELRAEQIDCRIFIDSSRPTGVMVKERISTARTRVAYYRSGSAASALTQADLPLDLLSEYQMLHLTGITAALGEGPREAVTESARSARQAGVRVSFDFNYRSKHWGTRAAAEFYRSIMPLCDLVFASDDEAALLFPETSDPTELAARILGAGPAEAVIKLGDRGELARYLNDEDQIPARSARVLDTVGAGDSFVAGYLAESMLGADLPRRLRIAVDAESLTCETVGDWEGAPSRANLEDFEREIVQR